MNAMDHGPFVSSTISTDPMSTRSIIAYKGIAVKVGDDRDAVVVFDTDLLRLATAWTGGFLKWYPARDGLQEFPSPDGFTHFSTGQRPGWSQDGKFDDSRVWKYGPIPKRSASYKGLYLNGEQVVFSYSVGETNVLESPGFERIQKRPIFTRAFDLEPTGNALSIQLSEAPDGASTLLEQKHLSPTNGYISIQTGDQSRLVGYQGLPAHSKWRISDRHLILDLPPLEESLSFVVSIGPVLQATENGYMVEHLASALAPTDLSGLTQPGKARWEVQKTKVKLGTEDGAFVSDELTAPKNNPWNSFLRFSGVDFLSDGRAVVTSLSGEVWIVDGIEEGSNDLKWTRFATGLNQPHGVKVLNDKIYVTGRDQITLLHDRNSDGEADFYENFNNNVMAATNFHAFTMNLDTDSKGNFYFAKATPWPPVRGGVDAEITPHHGVLFRMPPDGSRLDVIASGLRNPNGLSIGPNDEIVYSDNEGNWVPTSKVHRILEGGFHGFIPSAHRNPRPSNFEKPILWVPHFVDNSPSTPIFITSQSWPEALQGQLLITSYGRGTLSLVLNEDVDGQWQGAHLTLPLHFQSGTIHGRFHENGHLYVAGLTSWQSVGHGGDWGSFHRIRYTGKPLHTPVAVNTRKGGIEIRFNEPLDPASATDPVNYQLSQWTYPWTSQYGTRGKVYSVNEPGLEGADDVLVQSIQLSEDRKAVILEIPELRQDLAQKSLGLLSGLPDMIDSSMGIVMAINYQLNSADGAELKHQIHKTIHRVAGDNGTITTAKEAGGTVSLKTPEPNSPTSRIRQVEPAIDSKTRVIDISSSGIALNFSVTEIHLQTGERLVIRYHNASEMTHNIVIVKDEADIFPVGIAAMSAPGDDFVPKNLNPTAYYSQKQDRIIAASPLAYPDDTVYLEFTPSEAGVYPYICTYSGHFTMMQGRIIVEP